jgi:site-specific DNA-methyltransferase (adenine-specific)
MIETIRGDKKSVMSRPLLEKNIDTFIRFNEAIGIIRKITKKTEPTIDSIISSQTPFGFHSNFNNVKETANSDDVYLHMRNGGGYISRSLVKQNIKLIDKHKVYISEVYGERGSFPYFVLGKPFIGDPKTCCTQTYRVIGPLESKLEVKNVISYIKTKFFRFLVLLKKNTQHAPRSVYSIVPMQDFSEPWTDEKLYAKYGITAEEQAFIESMIRPMEVEERK